MGHLTTNGTVGGPEPIGKLLREPQKEAEAMAKPRAFISFEMEDRWARDFLAQQAKDKNNDIEY